MTTGFRFLLVAVALWLSPARMAVAQPQAIQNDQARALDHDFQLAVAAYDSGKFSEAALDLERLLAKLPRSFEVHELLGLTYAAQSHDDNALKHLKIAAELKPDSAAARTNLATALAHAGHSDEAVKQYHEAIEIDPHDYQANHNLAEIYLSSNKIADAIPLLEEAERLQPASYDNDYDLALAYLVSGKLVDARHIVDGLAAQKDSGELHTLRGRIDEKESKFIEAGNEFATAAHMDPSEDNLFVWASELLLHRTYEPAITVFEQATQRYPQSPRLFIGLGMALYARGEYEKSIQSLLTAADLNPTDPRCYLFLSKAYLSSPNQAEDVIGRFRRYAQLEPRNALAQYYYAMSLWKGKRLDNPHVDYHSIESLLQQSIALDGTIADAHLQLGILYNDQRQYDKSLPEYERALQLNQNLPDAHYRLGQYYVHVGEKSKAQAEFDLYKKMQAQHQAEIDEERAEVRQFVISTNAASSMKP